MKLASSSVRCVLAALSALLAPATAFGGEEIGVQFVQPASPSRGGVALVGTYVVVHGNDV